MTLFDLLLLLSLVPLVGRVYRPRCPPLGGEVVRHRPLPLLARIRLYRRSMLLIAVAGIAAAATDRVHSWTLAAVGLGLAALLVVPVAYSLTDEGIAFARSRPRRWTEFGGVGRVRGGARLQGSTGARGMTVWLSDSRDDDEFVLLLRQMVRRSYKGEIGSPRSRQQEEGSRQENGSSDGEGASSTQKAVCGRPEHDRGDGEGWERRTAVGAMSAGGD